MEEREDGEEEEEEDDGVVCASCVTLMIEKSQGRELWHGFFFVDGLV